MSAGGFDYNDFKKFRNNFNTMYNQFDAWIENFLLNEGLRFIASVKPRTPVDTGDLRNHWQLNGITRGAGTLECWFVNPMYYATFVEYGHATPYNSGAGEGSAGWVQGYFMMTVSIEKIRTEMPARFDRAFRQFLRGLGVL